MVTARKVAAGAVLLAFVGFLAARFVARRDGGAAAWDKLRAACETSVAALNGLADQRSYETGLDAAAMQTLADSDAAIADALATIGIVTGIKADFPTLASTSGITPTGEAREPLRAAAVLRKRQCTKTLVISRKMLGWRGLFTGC